MTEDELREYILEWREFGYLFIRARWTMDGARTLTEAAQRFRDRAETLEQSLAPGSSWTSRPTTASPSRSAPGQESPMLLVEEDTKASP